MYGKNLKRYLPKDLQLSIWVDSVGKVVNFEIVTDTPPLMKNNIFPQNKIKYGVSVHAYFPKTHSRTDNSVRVPINNLQTIIFHYPWNQRSRAISVK